LAKFKHNNAEEATTWSPIVLESIGIDLDETEDALIAHLALPGLSNGDFKVEVTEDRLVIRGGKKDSRNKRRRGYSRFEESQATFAQAISLPCQIDRDRVEARFKNGLLTVTMPKRAK
jgi:HSP20 family protein